MPFRLLLMKPVRCGECYYRFYRPHWIPALPRERRDESIVPINRASA